MKQIIAETLKLLPTQAIVNRDIVYNIFNNFDESRFEAPYVLETIIDDFPRLLLINGHHRAYVQYLRNVSGFGVVLVENDQELFECSKGFHKSLDEFVGNYTRFIKPYFEQLEIYDISDLKKKSI